MSIIYDALRKAEKKGKDKVTSNKNKSILFSILIGLVVVLIFVGLTFNYLIKGRHKRKVVGRKVYFTKKHYQDNKLILEGIIYDEGKPLAVINGKVLREGDSVGNFKIKSIGTKNVQLIGTEQDRVITLTF